MKLPHFSLIAAPIMACLLPLAPRVSGAEFASGYLVDEMFGNLSPNWQNLSLRKLSDWEVDSRAGSVTSSYWQHIELNDTSSTLGFELRKRFLPQNAGSVIVDFAFSGTAKRDGRIWSVQGGADLDAVKFMTSGGSFGYETSTGTFTPLLNYVAGEILKVRAIIYPSAGRFDVYINGKKDPINGSRISFRNAVADISSFYVATSPSGTDSLRMYYLTIVKGYILHERFLNAKAGVMPESWGAVPAGGIAAPTEWITTNPKDTLSMKLEDSSTSQQASLNRYFTSSDKKLAWEYKFLVPKKVDGMTMILRSGTAAAARIRTSGLNIVCDQPGNQSLILWTDYKENVWYCIRVVADPATDLCDFYVNGKKRASGIPFVAPVTFLDNVAFGTSVSGTGTLWLDDIYLREAPAISEADIPAIQQTVGITHHLGMQTFFSGWRNGHHGGWDWIYRFPDHDSYLGQYDEGNVLAMEWQLKWMKEAGVDFLLDCWSKPWGNTPIKEPLYQYTEGGLHEGYFYAKNSEKVKFAIADFSLGAPATFRDYVIPYWLEYYFRDPRYFTIANKPVVSFGNSGEWMSSIGIAGVRAEIDNFKSVLQRNGFDGAICLAVYSGTDPNAIQAMAQAGFDAFYAYNRDTNDLSQIKDTLENARNASAGRGIVSLPVAPHGRNGEGWDLPNHGYLSAGEFESLLRWMRDEYFVGSGTIQGEKLELLANWNEYGEGYFLCPTRLTGFSYLDAARRVFTSSGIVNNQTPSNAEKDTWSVLYSRARLGRFWGFDSLYPDLEGWTASLHIANLKQEKGFVSGEVINGDPALFSRNGHAVAAANSRITFRMKNSSAASLARIYFETPTSGFSQAQSKAVNIAPNSDFKQYTVDMSTVPGWTGVISRIRLDPFDDGTRSGSFSLDYIRLVKP